MSQENDRYRRIVFDLPVREVPALLEYLGSFISEHDIQLTSIDAGSDITEAHLGEETAADKYITHIDDLEEGRLEIVTAANLRDFALDRYSDKGTRSKLGRIANAMFSYYNTTNRPAIDEYCYADSDDNLLGIRVSKAEDLLDQLHLGQENYSNGLRMTRVGTGAIRVFEEFCKEVIQGRDASNSQGTV